MDGWDDSYYAALDAIRTHEPNVQANQLSCYGCDWSEGEIEWADHVLATIPDYNPPPEPKPAKPPRSVGVLGVIAGVPIMGTNDVINAGPPKIPPGLDYEEGMAKLASEVEPHPYQPGAALNYMCMRCGTSLGLGNHIP